MSTLFALVLTVISLNGESQDVVIDVYDSQQGCQPQPTNNRLTGNAGQ